ncbi:HNH homing endonuclease [Pseudoalteromonas phage PH357]|nr:HNH homing endonuclease [Pseudoalteromonas phage PH357]
MKTDEEEKWVDLSYLIEKHKTCLKIKADGEVMLGDRILRHIPTDRYQKYLRVSFSLEGVTYRFFIHRLLALAFIPNPDGHKYVGHKDDDHLNNDISNLYWVSARDNQLNLNNTKDKSPKVKWKELYPLIRELLSAGLSYAEVVDNLPVDPTNSKLEYIRQLDNGYRGSLWEGE